MVREAERGGRHEGGGGASGHSCAWCLMLQEATRSFELQGLRIDIQGDDVSAGSQSIEW